MKFLESAWGTFCRNTFLLVVAVQLCGWVLSPPPARAQAGIPIEHFIFIIQENHSFDNYFGTFPGANGIPKGTRLPIRPGGPLVEKPFRSGSHIPDLNHDWVSAKLDYDNGAMDGFFWGEWPEAKQYNGLGIITPKADPNLVRPYNPTPTPTTTNSSHRLPVERELSPNGFADDEDPADPGVEARNEALLASEKPDSSPPPRSKMPNFVKYTFSYVDYRVIPNYWEYALTYTLCDNFFSSLEGPSLPNHLYLVAGQSGGLCTEANGHWIYDYFYFPCIADLLGNANVSWTYHINTINNVQAEYIWNPLPGFQPYTKYQIAPHLTTTSQFYTDIKNGTLPQVSYLIPSIATSEHPTANIQAGCGM
jgi:phospholipase C